MQKMEKVKKELAEAKQIRKNRQEYDVLSKLIKVTYRYIINIQNDKPNNYNTYRYIE
jgi:hypothetical protein